MYRILFVDDDVFLLEQAKRYMDLQEFTIDTSTSAIECLKVEEIPLYDAIVSDYQMPGMDGITFLKEVRSRFGDLPFIIFTGKCPGEVVIEAINNGVDFYQQKGDDYEAQFAELTHKIRVSVKRKQTERALAESEAQYREIFENAVIGIYKTSPDSRYLQANKRAAELLGYDSPEA